MKFKVLSGVLIFIVLIAFITMSHPIKFFEPNVESYNPKDTDPLVQWKPNEFSDDGRKEVIKRIKKIQQILEKLSSGEMLNDNRIKGIGNFYGDPGVFTKHDGDTLKGRQEIEDYFSDERDSIKNIEFKLEYVFAEELTHILENPSKKPENDIVHVLYLVISCSFDYEGVRIDPGGSTNQKHMRSCAWD
jgi:hypothetical protein